jgi:mannose/fructose/N-acetylgalactosamine-specific phosphotransferase system component IIC
MLAARRIALLLCTCHFSRILLAKQQTLVAVCVAGLICGSLMSCFLMGQQQQSS